MAGSLFRSDGAVARIALSPFCYGTVLQEDARHWLRAPERIFTQRFLREVKSQSGLLGQRVLAIHHSHGGEAEPLRPDFVSRLRHYVPAALLHQKVGDRRIKVD